MPENIFEKIFQRFMEFRSDRDDRNEKNGSESGDGIFFHAFFIQSAVRAPQVIIYPMKAMENIRSAARMTSRRNFFRAL